MNHWDILGIARTNDQKIIRKAYATLLKTIDQELEPEKFIALRAAFESAKNEHITPDHLPSAEDSAVNQPSAVDPIEIESVSSPDQSLHIPQEAIPLHQRGFEFLLHAIEQQNSDIDLRTELRDYTDYILNLEPDILSNEQAQAYLQQLHDACIAAGLRGLNDFLNLNPDKDLVYSKTNSNSTENTQVLLLNPELQFRAGLDELSQQLWDENFNDQVFEQFSQVLHQWQHQTLDTQMAAYDQLNHVLGSINSTSSESNRFFEVWYEYFGNEIPPASADSTSHRLYDRLENLVNHHTFWRQIPEQYVKSFEALQRPDTFQPFRVLKLLLSVNSFIQSLRKNNWIGIPGMVEPERNMNLHFLRLWTLWIRNFSIQLMISLVCIFIAASVFEFSFRGTFGICLPLSLLYFPLFLSVGLAKMFASTQPNLIIARLINLFYLSIIILALFSPFMNTRVLEILLSAWCILATFVLGYGLYFYHNIFDYLKEVINIRADKIFVYLGFSLIVLILSVIIFQVQDNNSFGILFAVLPISLLLCGDLFKNFFSQLLKTPDKPEIKFFDSIKFSAKFIGFILIFIGLIVVKADVDGPTLRNFINLPLASALIASISLSFLSGKAVSYVSKYLSYIVLIAISIASIILPILFSYYLYHTAKVDRQLK
ncbi:MAG: hypothetical protein EOO69_01850 [Moraxellaceae bacterium]|nr:MAG: hypothetical protein EOO69_01850 [Moraxellaceae bacterium]